MTISYQSITDNILKQLEEGARPWRISWSTEVPIRIPKNAITKSNYSGINILLLWDALQTNGFAHHEWMTFKQAVNAGYNIRKGEKGTKVFYYKLLEKEDESNSKKSLVPLARWFTVFNVDQFQNWSSNETPCIRQNGIEADELIKRHNCDLRHYGTKALYNSTRDYIVIPEHERFNSDADYYATLLHELTHWTGHPTRLDRALINKFGDDAYAFEELVAEMGSAFLCADLGVNGQLMEHASYIDGWLKILKQNARAIFKAASLASKAHQYLIETTKQEGSS